MLYKAGDSNSNLWELKASLNDCSSAFWEATCPQLKLAQAKLAAFAPQRRHRLWFQTAVTKDKVTIDSKGPFVYWWRSSQWDGRLKMQGLARESGEATVSTQGKAVCMGDIRKPLLPPRCTAGTSMVRQSALCSPLNFFTKSQRCLCLSGLSQFTFLKHCLHLNLYFKKRKKKKIEGKLKVFL